LSPEKGGLLQKGDRRYEKRQRRKKLKMSEEGGILKVGVEGRLSFWENLVYGLQHYFLIGMSAFIVPMIFLGAFAQAGPLALSFDKVAYLVGAMLIGAGIVTLTQSSILLKLPVAQGQAIILIVLMISTVFAYGWGVTYAGLILAGILTTVLTLPFSKGVVGWLSRSITPPAVYGTLVLLIGVTMAPQVAFGNMIMPGGQLSSGMDLILALIAFLVPLFLMIFVKKGFFRSASVFIGLLIAVVVAAISGRIDWSPVASAQWITVPQIFPMGFEWNWGPVIISGLIMFVGYLAAVSESIGVYTLVTNLDPSQKLNKERINKGIFGESLGSVVGTLIGSVPSTTYAQNVGLMALTGVGARSVITTCGLLLVLSGFIYKVGAIVAVIPLSIYGGSLLAVLAMLIAVGISTLSKMKWTDVNMAIIGTGIAIGVGALFWNIHPQGSQMLQKLHPVWGIFLGNPALLGFLVTWVLYAVFVLPREKEA
jgi:xanthine/uracil permease